MASGRGDADADAQRLSGLSTVQATAQPAGRPPELAATVVPPAPAAAEDLPALPPVDPDSYAIGDEIARGGMGRILAARDRRLRRDVAIKVLRERDASPARFDREALITARLQHPSIVRVYDAGRLDGAPFYAMERVRGRSLDRVVAGAPDAAARLALLPHVIAVADALAYAHSEGVIHRDLKPGNVLVGSFGETVVIDWGLAKDLRAGDADSWPGPDRRVPIAGADDLTVAGAVMGTPAYMAPEQARGEPADTRSDVYAIGALLYAVLAGAPPIAGDGDHVVDYVAHGAITPLARRAPEAPPELVSIVERAMAFEPAARYATASELADELRRYAAGQLVGAHAYSTATLIRRWIARHRAAVAVAAAALAVLVVFGALAVSRVVRERDRADRETVIARDALRRAEAEADALVLTQADRALGEDPALALAWVQRLSTHGIAGERARAIAVEALRRGVAFELGGPGDDVEYVMLGTEGTIAFTASDDGHVWRWDLAARVGADLGGHTGPIEAIARSADGRWLATGGTDHVVRLWDTATGVGRALTGHGEAVRGAAFSPDSATLATTSEDGTLRLWTVATGEGTVAIRIAHALRPVAWSRDGARLWAGGADGMLRELTIATGAVRAAKAHVAELRALDLSPDGAWLASGGEDGTVSVWSTAALRGRILGTHADVVRDVAWTPDGTRLVSAGGDPIVRVHRLDAGATVDLGGNQSGIKDVAISPDGAWVASAGIDRAVRIWPVDGGAPRVLSGHRASVKSIGYTPDGAAIVSGSDDNHVRIWPLADPGPPPAGEALRGWLAARTNVTVAPP
jgi:WD40 repeat protein/predicted Ser/Thr protein kinase